MELSTQLNKNGRFNILTDGEFRFAVSAFVYRSFPFRDGDEVTEENLAELKAADDAERAHESALRMLTARAHGKNSVAPRSASAPRRSSRRQSFPSVCTESDTFPSFR